jgi:hypothetical protein
MTVIKDEYIARARRREESANKKLEDNTLEFVQEHGYRLECVSENVFEVSKPPLRPQLVNGLDGVVSLIEMQKQIYPPDFKTLACARLVLVDPAPELVGVEAVGQRRRRDGDAGLLADGDEFGLEFGAVFAAHQRC